MADEKKIEIVLDEVPTHPMAPAIHSDTLWDGPRWVHHATEKPVWCETKQQYWDLLAKNGFRMADMAESSVQSSVPQKDVEIPLEFQPAPIPQQMAKGEAHLWAAASAVFHGRDLMAFFSCTACFARKKFHYCEVVMQPSQIRVTCKCGSFGYRPPTGTTDLFLSKLQNIGIKSEAPTVGTLVSAAGERLVPTVLLTDQEAAIIKAFAKTLMGRDLVLHPFHRTCFAGDPTDDSNEVGMQVTHNDVVFVCACRQLCHRANRVLGSVH